MAEDGPRDRYAGDAESAGTPSPATDALRRAGRAVGISLRDPVIVVLLLAGFFDGISGNPVHWIVLYGAAFALGRDALRQRAAQGSAPAAGPETPEEAERQIRGSVALGTDGMLADPAADPRAAARRLVQVPLALTAGLIGAVIVGGFARYSWPATIAVVITGVTVLVLSWPGPLTPRPEPGPIGTVGTVAWLAAFIGLGLWEFTQLLLQPSLTVDSYAHPTLSTLSEGILSSHPGRSVGLIVWLLFGWFLARR